MKNIFYIALFCAFNTTIFAVETSPLNLSLGGGMIWGFSKSSSQTKDTRFNTKLLMHSTNSFHDVNVDGFSYQYNNETADIGSFAFVDCSFLEASAAFVLQFGKMSDRKTKSSIYIPSMTYTTSFEANHEDKDYLSTVFLFDFLAKYPIKTGKRLTLFPALGAGIKLPINSGEGSGFKHTSWIASVQAGGGADFTLDENFFLRSEFLVSYSVAESEKSTMDLNEKDSSLNGTLMVEKQDFEFINKNNFNPQLRIAIGYKIPAFNRKADKKGAETINLEK